MVEDNVQSKNEKGNLRMRSALPRRQRVHHSGRNWLACTDSSASGGGEWLGESLRFAGRIPILFSGFNLYIFHVDNAVNT